MARTRINNAHALTFDELQRKDETYAAVFK